METAVQRMTREVRDKEKQVEGTTQELSLSIEVDEVDRERELKLEEISELKAKLTEIKKQEDELTKEVKKREEKRLKRKLK